RQIGLGFPCDQKCPETREGHSQYLWRNLPRHHRSNGQTCKTPARKYCPRSVSKPRPGMNGTKTVHRLAPPIKGKTSWECNDGPRQARKGSVLLHERGDWLSHQSIPR